MVAQIMKLDYLNMYKSTFGETKNQQSVKIWRKKPLKNKIL